VAGPIVSASSSSTWPPGAEMTTPIAAGPGLPRAPPSTCTRSAPGGSDGVTACEGSLSGQGRKLARDPGSAPIPALAALASVRAGSPGSPPRSLATIHDHRHVGIVGVVLAELVEQLAGQRFGNHAVDHSPDAIRRRPKRPSNVRPEVARRAKVAPAHRRRRWPPARMAPARRAPGPGRPAGRRRPRRPGRTHSDTSRAPRR
jgi:hypothetical protein